VATILRDQVVYCAHSISRFFESKPSVSRTSMHPLTRVSGIAVRPQPSNWRLGVWMKALNRASNISENGQSLEAYVRERRW